MPPSPLILSLLEAFRNKFSGPTWAKVIPLIRGTILARCQRTVAAALRQAGLDHDPKISKYHQIFNQSDWRPLRPARRLVHLIYLFQAVGLRLTFAIDETLERRWGLRIRLRGHYRDPMTGLQQWVR